MTSLIGAKLKKFKMDHYYRFNPMPAMVMKICGRVNTEVRGKGYCAECSQPDVVPYLIQIEYAPRAGDEDKWLQISGDEFRKQVHENGASLYKAAMERAGIKEGQVLSKEDTERVLGEMDGKAKTDLSIMKGNPKNN